MSETVQLMLVVECTSAVQQPLAEALDRLEVACVLIVPVGWQTRGTDEMALPALASVDQETCQSLVKFIQNHEAAAIIANDAAAAQASGADGCHLDASGALEDNYQTSRRLLGSRAIVGVMPGETRHMAMTLAEAGADYIGYCVTSDPDDPGLQFVSWWAEIFQSPVVAFVDGDVESCRRAIAAGPPDFLAVPLKSNDDLERLTRIAMLIEECGQLPIPAKDAK